MEIFFGLRYRCCVVRSPEYETCDNLAYACNSMCNVNLLKFIRYSNYPHMKCQTRNITLWYPNTHLPRQRNPSPTLPSSQRNPTLFRQRQRWSRTTLPSRQQRRNHTTRRSTHTPMTSPWTNNHTCRRQRIWMEWTRRRTSLRGAWSPDARNTRLTSWCRYSWSSSFDRRSRDSRLTSPGSWFWAFENSVHNWWWKRFILRNWADRKSWFGSCGRWNGFVVTCSTRCYKCWIFKGYSDVAFVFSCFFGCLGLTGFWTTEG